MARFLLTSFRTQSLTCLIQGTRKKSAVARKLDKNPRTIKRYLDPDMSAVSKAYGSKRNGSVLAPYYEEINRAFDKGMMTSKIEQLIRERGYEGSTSLIRHYVSGIKKARKRCNAEKEPTRTIERKQIIQLLYHSKKRSNRMTEEECDLVFEQYPFVKELYKITQQFKKY